MKLINLIWDVAVLVDINCFFRLELCPESSQDDNLINIFFLFYFMDKAESIVSILGIFFLLALIIYSATSSGFTMFLHLILLISGLFISILTINKLTKSKNSLKSKIYSSLIISLLIFFSIIFFWFLGDHSSIDDKGLTTGIIIIPTSLFFGLVSFITGLVLSIKRKTREDFEYNLGIYLGVFSIIFLILFVLFFYNPSIFGLATFTNSKNLCYLIISPNLNSYLSYEGFEQRCLTKTSIENSKTGSVDCSGIDDPEMCYVKSAINNQDIKICIDNADSPTDEAKYNDYCRGAIRYLEEEIFNILKTPQHQDILHAIKSTPALGIYHDEDAENKYIPLIKNIVVQGNLEAKRESLEILLTWARAGSLEEEKIILREQILPLIENQPELEEYVAKINQRLSAVVVVLQPSSNISTE